MVKKNYSFFWVDTFRVFMWKELIAPKFNILLNSMTDCLQGLFDLINLYEFILENNLNSIINRVSLAFHPQRIPIIFYHNLSANKIILKNSF